MINSTPDSTSNPKTPTHESRSYVELAKAIVSLGETAHELIQSPFPGDIRPNEKIGAFYENELLGLAAIAMAAIIDRGISRNTVERMTAVNLDRLQKSSGFRPLYIEPLDWIANLQNALREATNQALDGVDLEGVDND